MPKKIPTSLTILALGSTPGERAKIDRALLVLPHGSNLPLGSIVHMLDGEDRMKLWTHGNIIIDKKRCETRYSSHLRSMYRNFFKLGLNYIRQEKDNMATFGEKIPDEQDSNEEREEGEAVTDSPTETENFVASSYEFNNCISSRP